MQRQQTYTYNLESRKWAFYGAQVGGLLFLKNHTLRVVFKRHMPK